MESRICAKKIKILNCRLTVNHEKSNRCHFFLYHRIDEKLRWYISMQVVIFTTVYGKTSIIKNGKMQTVVCCLVWITSFRIRNTYQNCVEQIISISVLIPLLSVGSKVFLNTEESWIIIISLICNYRRIVVFC